MTSSTLSGPGHVLSADIAVPEHERVKQFYSSVLTTGDDPLWRDDLMNSDGIPIIGLGERNASHADLPVQWMPHIQVADVAASVARAVDQGGRELLQNQTDDGQSQWAVLADPSGTAFGLIPVVPAEAIPPLEGGRIAWLDLTVNDADATRDFYMDVLGLTVENVSMEDAAGEYADYALGTPDGGAVAGVCHARGTNADLPPVWLIYLPVGDLDESLSRVHAGGGEVIRASRGSAGTHTYAVVRDPVGACFALVPG